MTPGGADRTDGDGVPWSFELSAESEGARRGRLTTAHGTVETPAFMPVGTQAAVRHLTPDQVRATGAEVVLANTYHLGSPERLHLVERNGGLHRLMRWPRTVLTDSGGFQVFSLPDSRIDEEGVCFQRPGSERTDRLTPEGSLNIQRRLGADIVMAFDECVDHRADPAYVRRAMERTHRWLERCVAVELSDHQHLFGIVQGGMDLELRERSAVAVTGFDLPGYAIGGVSVGEGHTAMVRVVRHTAPLLPADRPRYLMGVGLPEDLVASVACGMDLHDCVIPTRYGREGTVFTWDGKLRIRDKRFRKDRYPIDTACRCYACASGFSRSYLRHLLFAGEPLGEVLLSIHNLHFYQDLMRAMREAIEADRFGVWREGFTASRQRKRKV